MTMWELELDDCIIRLTGLLIETFIKEKVTDESEWDCVCVCFLCGLRFRLDFSACKMRDNQGAGHKP